MRRSTAEAAPATSCHTECSMRPISVLRNAADVPSSSCFEMAKLPHGPLPPIAPVRCALGMRFKACVRTRRRLQAGVSRICCPRSRRVGIISTSRSAERDHRSSDTGAGSGPFFSSSRRPSLPGRCRQTPVRPRGPFTGTAAHLRRRRFCGCRPFRAAGSSKEAIVSRSGKPAMPLLRSWPRSSADRSPPSSLERSFVEDPL